MILKALAYANTMICLGLNLIFGERIIFAVKLLLEALKKKRQFLLIRGLLLILFDLLKSNATQLYLRFQFVVFIFDWSFYCFVKFIFSKLK